MWLRHRSRKQEGPERTSAQRRAGFDAKAQEAYHSRLLRFVRVREADEMEDERIHDFVWKCILFVNQHADEERVGT